MLYRQTPQAIGGHMLAATLIVYAIWPAVAHERLIGWLLGVLVVSVTRASVCFSYLNSLPVPDAETTWWTRALTFLAFMQTLLWGLAVFIIWPEDTEYRALVIVTLAGVIAAGGVMLAVHRRSFIIYCLPIAVPAIIRLTAEGGRIEMAMAVLILIYSVLLMIAVNRLGTNFFEGMRVRLQMESLSRTDPLTHLANRRAFDEYTDNVWQSAIRSGQSVGLIVADIDHFKAYNDRYGHPAGDVALTRVAQVLTNAAGRTTDMCARTGGEEFAIILPSTDVEGTKIIAEQIQSLLAKAGIRHEAAPVGYLTMSMGYGAVVPTSSITAQDSLAAADKALYRAKSSGRNHIEAAHLEPASALSDQNSIDALVPNP